MLSFRNTMHPSHAAAGTDVNNDDEVNSHILLITKAIKKTISNNIH